MTVNDKVWTNAKEICEALEYKKKTAQLIKCNCSSENYAHKCELSKLPPVGTLIDYPKDLRKDNI